MKKAIAAVVLFFALAAQASVVTNYVYVVSNIFNNVYSTTVITQKVKSSHMDYYFTNYVSVVTNVYQTTFQTNIEVNVIFDNFEPYVAAASNQANRASSFASTAASSATAASGSASSAAASAASAAVSSSAANAAATNGLARINERIDWFEEHSGETITNINISTTVNIHVDTYGHPYVTPDGVTTNSNFIYYPIATENGKVAITTIGNHKPSIEYVFIPAYGGSSSACWVFEPAYVDSDANGMRLHYLPKTTNTVTATTYNAGDKYIPRDFYWQNGVLYAVIDGFNGSVWRGSIKMKYAGTGDYLYPNGIGDTYADTSGTRPPWYQYMTFVSREGSIMGTGTTANFGYVKTKNGSVLPSADSILWFPENPSVAQQAIINWLATWQR